MDRYNTGILLTSNFNIMNKEQFLQRAVLSLLSNSDFTKTARDLGYEEEYHAIKCADELVNLFNANFYVKEDEEKFPEDSLQIAKSLDGIAEQMKNLAEILDRRLKNINDSICLFLR